MPKIEDPLHDLAELSEGLETHVDELEAALIAWVQS